MKIKKDYLFLQTSFIILLIILCSGSNAGFLRSRLAYSAGFPAPIPFAAGHHYGSTYGAPPFAAPLPVAPLPVAPNSHPYAAVGYSAPTVFKVRSRGSSFGPFSAYGSIRSHHKFAYPAPVPSFYNAPLPVSYEAPEIPYDFEVPNTVVKFGPPITTTTTTYSTTAAATAAAVHVATPLNAANGW